MWSVTCERCGAPAEVAIPPPRVVRCGSCKSVAPASPPLEERLDRAAHLVARVVARTARLGGVGRRIVGLGQRALVFLSLPWVFAVGMLAFVGALNLASALDGHPRDVSRALVLLPLSAMLFATGGATLIALRRRILEIEALARADPPEAPNEPARCPVCGGGLPIPGLRAIVECGFCKSDVVVDPRLLSRAERSAVKSLDEVERTLDARASALASLGFTRVLWIVGAGLVFAFVLSVCGGLVGAAIDVTEVLTGARR